MIGCVEAYAWCFADPTLIKNLRVAEYWETIIIFDTD